LVARTVAILVLVLLRTGLVVLVTDVALSEELAHASTNYNPNRGKTHTQVPLAREEGFINNC
jgi:hypothetical protein